MVVSMYIVANVFLQITNNAVPDMRGSADRTTQLHRIFHLTGELVSWDPLYYPDKAVLRVS